MDNPIITDQPVHVNNKITFEEFVFELIRLNLELLSIDPHSLFKFDEAGKPIEVNAKIMKELYDRIEAIAKLIHYNRVHFNN